jgi:deazaflavin-dependent oxidoreductase (nitroreductase family)
VKLPRSVARFNRVVTNPIQGRWAWGLPPWAVICHRGRRSGRRYRTPVIAFKRGSTFAIVVMYGPESDWVRNVLAGPAEVVRSGRTHDLLDPRVVAPEGQAMPAAARLIGRATGVVLLAELGPAKPGFGRGP